MLRLAVRCPGAAGRHPSVTSVIFLGAQSTHAACPPLFVLCFRLCCFSSSFLSLDSWRRFLTVFTALQGALPQPRRVFCPFIWTSGCLTMSPGRHHRQGGDSARVLPAIESWVASFMTLILSVSSAGVSAAQVRGVMSVLIGALTR